MKREVNLVHEMDYDKFKVQLVALPSQSTEFVDGPLNPLQTIGKLARGYSGVYSNEDPTPEQQKSAIDDLNRTKLQTPYEMMTFVFLISNVTRSFTHQLVRTRVGASFVQESMRFLGHQGVYRILTPSSIMLRGALDEYSNACFKSIESYEQMMSMGVSGEDARDVLPHGILTSAFVGYTLSALKKVYEQRMCCQAQSGQWQIFSKDMKNLIGVNYGPTLVTAVSAPFERGEPCGYRASFDRPCLWQKSKED